MHLKKGRAPESDKSDKYFRVNFAKVVYFRQLIKTKVRYCPSDFVVGAYFRVFFFGLGARGSTTEVGWLKS